MKISKAAMAEVPFKELDYGDAFRRGCGVESIKTEGDGRYNAVDICDGELILIGDDDLVTPLPNAEFVY